MKKKKNTASKAMLNALEEGLLLDPAVYKAVSCKLKLKNKQCTKEACTDTFFPPDYCAKCLKCGREWHLIVFPKKLGKCKHCGCGGGYGEKKDQERMP